MSALLRTRVEAADLLTQAAEAHLFGNFSLEEELLCAWRDAERYEKALVLLGFTDADPLP